MAKFQEAPDRWDRMRPSANIEDRRFDPPARYDPATEVLPNPVEPIVSGRYDSAIERAAASEKGKIRTILDDPDGSLRFEVLLGRMFKEEERRARRRSHFDSADYP